MELTDFLNKIYHKATHSIFLFLLGIVMLWLAIDLGVGFVGAIIPGMLIGGNIKHVYGIINRKLKSK